MTCLSCGKEFDASKMFCTRCGTPKSKKEDYGANNCRDVVFCIHCSTIWHEKMEYVETKIVDVNFHCLFCS